VTGIDLENQSREPNQVELTRVVSMITLSVFTMEVSLKMIAEAFEPWQYFLDRENGAFNCFDFFIVALSFIFLESAGSTISALRMLRLVRLLTFIKNVPQLRMIVAGLVQVCGRVWEHNVYIVILFTLLHTFIYIYWFCDVCSLSLPPSFLSRVVGVLF
jgi:hypothetical protein